TPLVSNTIDSRAPSSLVAPLPVEAGPTFLVQWSGQDDPGGSGVANFDLYVGIDGSNYVRWLSSPNPGSAWFHGQPGHTYGFYSAARDFAGNEEPLPGTPQAFTTVPTNAPSLLMPTNTLSVTVGDLLSSTNLVFGIPIGSFLFSLGSPAPSGAA